MLLLFGMYGDTTIQENRGLIGLMIGRNKISDLVFSLIGFTVS